MRTLPRSGEFDVRRYGAKGDGVTDDTAAINRAIDALTAAGRGVLFFPAGKYNTSGGHTLSVPCQIVGQGQGYFHDDGTSGYYFLGTACSLIRCTSGSAFCFAFTTPYATVENLSWHCVSGTTPTAGGAFKCQGDGSGGAKASRYQFRNVTILDGYYGVEHAVGAYSVFLNVSFVGQRQYMLYMRNDANADWGDSCVSNCFFTEHGSHATVAAIRYESGGGLKVTDNKFVGPGIGHGLWGHFDTGSNSGQLFVIGNSFDGVSGNPIRLETAGTGTFSKVVIDGNYIASGGATAEPVYINNGGAFGSLGGIQLSNCDLLNGQATGKPIITVTGNGGVTVTLGAGITWGGSSTALYTKGASDSVTGGMYANPAGLMAVHLGDGYGGTPGAAANVKVFVYEDATSVYGLGISPGLMESQVPDVAAHGFFVGGSLKLKVNATGAGFNGATPVGKATLSAAATDAATTQALTNQIRLALINLGLAQ